MFLDVIAWFLIILGLPIALLGAPGSLMAIPALLIWWYWGTMTLSTLQFVLLVGLCLAAEGFEQLGGFIGMSVAGIHRYGIWGTFFGFLVGVPLSIVLLNPLVLMVTVVVGAVGGELVAGRSPGKALMICAGFFLGKFGGYLVKNLLFIGVVCYLIFLHISQLV